MATRIKPKQLSALERFQIGVAIFVSLSTSFIAWKTFQLNEISGVSNERLRQIEVRLSERRFDFEQFKDIYDRVDKYLMGEQEERRGRALVILVSAIHESSFRAELLSILTVQATKRSVSTAAAESYVGKATLISKVPARFEGKLELKRVADNNPTYKVVGPLSFVDSAGTTWSVPTGFLFTGASTPRLAWDVISPAGEAAAAFVLYEFYTTQKSGRSPAVNQMFLEALVAAGVDLPKAKALFVAVETLGPRVDARSQNGGK